MSSYLLRTEKIISRIDELAGITEDAGIITRRYGSAAFMEAGRKVLHWMREAGLQARIDAIGNVRGVWRSDQAAAKTLVIASHIDTVRNAGRWDGPLGVLMGLDLLENMIRAKRRLPFHIELIAFCDEEGVRFHSTYLGSKVVAGSFEADMLNRKDEEGITLEEVIRLIGGNPEGLKQEAIVREDWLGYFEIHIEQGPVLFERKIPVAPVTAIAGQIRAEVVFRGMAGHAGTVPMDMRADALCAAAEFVLELEKLAVSAHHELVATAGKLQVLNAASNVIPGEVVASLDLRSADEQVLASAYDEIVGLCEGIGRRRGVTVIPKVMQASLPVVCDGRMNELLTHAIQESGYEVLTLVSGAGHDAVAVAAVAPVAMLFVRCYRGISHNPLENVEAEDITAAIAVCDNFIQQLTEIWRYQP